MDARVLFRDEHIAVVFKPYGMLSEAHDSLPNLPAFLREECGCGACPVHRLDRTTEGLMVYALTPAAAAVLSEAIRSGNLHKEYLAAVEGVPEDRAELCDLLYYDRARGKSYVVRRARRGVREARLRYERLACAEYEGRAVSLVRIELLTGRTHQIRVQFASRRHPLVGDRRYGSGIAAEHIALCACSLRFPHPVTGEELRFDCAPTDEMFGLFGEIAETT